MAITTVGAAGNGANFVDYPSGIQSGDLIILVVAAYSVAAVPAPTGYTKRLETSGGSGEAQCSIYTRVATGALSGTIGGPAGGVGVGVIVLRGADTTTFFDPTYVTRQTGFAQVHQFPAVTTGDPCTILWVETVVGDTTSETNTFGSSAVVDAKSSSSGVFIGRTIQATEGLTNPPGQRTFASYLAGGMIALPVRPAGTPPPRPRITVSGASRAPYGRPIVGTATATATAVGATIAGYQWTVTVPGLAPAPTLAGATTTTCTYKPTAAGTPGIGGPAAQFTATCVVTDSNGRTGTAAFTTAVRAATLVRAGGIPSPAARRGRWNGTAH